VHEIHFNLCLKLEKILPTQHEKFWIPLLHRKRRKTNQSRNYTQLQEHLSDVADKILFEWEMTKQQDLIAPSSQSAFFGMGVGEFEGPTLLETMNTSRKYAVADALKTALHSFALVVLENGKVAVCAFGNEEITAELVRPT
jgi:hypothetical protein